MGVSLMFCELYLQNNLAKICNARNHIYGENFKLKLCMCAQVSGLHFSIKMTARRLWVYCGKTPNSSDLLVVFIVHVVQHPNTIPTPGRYGRGSQASSKLANSTSVWAYRKGVRECRKTVCLTVLTWFSTGGAIHQRSPTHGLDWPTLEINGSIGHWRWSRLANISNRWRRLSRPQVRILWKLLRHTSPQISA